MLSTYSMFMMVLLGAASLIGISSIYQPANVETQPQQSQQLVPPGQIQKQPPIVQQQPAQPQGLQPNTGKIITQQGAETLAQATADKQLLDRLFPQIIKRIDGNTLLQKIDAKTLAAKVIPHIQVTLRMGQVYSPLVQIKKDYLSSDSFHIVEAICPPGTRVMGGGGEISPERAGPSGLFDFNAKDVADNNIAALQIIPTNRLDMIAKMETGGYIKSYATCLGGTDVKLVP
jgi:hypothetical protein